MRFVCMLERTFEYEIFLPLVADRYASSPMIHATLTLFEAMLIVLIEGERMPPRNSSLDNLFHYLFMHQSVSRSYLTI